MSKIEPLPKSTSEEIRFELSEYKSSLYANIRVWYNASGWTLAAQADPDWQPSRKGITIAAEDLPDFVEKCQELLEEYEAMEEH